MSKRASRLCPIVFIWLISCASQPANQTRPQAPPVLDPGVKTFAREWQNYADETNASPRQPSCRPRMLPAAQSIPRRGAVVMFHGFGGCPQQFLELGRRVAARGFDVLLPLLPGHGVSPTPAGKDDLSRLPTAADREKRYSGLARRMNGIMARSSGTKVIVGFSLGGAISLNANLHARELYDRQLLLSPMFAIRGGAFVEGLAGFLGRVPGIRNIVVKPASARQECRSWQSAGRGGFCDYQWKHVVALLNLEDQNQAMHEASSLTTPMQIVAAGDEDYVSNDQIVSFTERQKANGPISLCFMPDDVPHELLSPYENDDLEMYWLDELLNDAVSFIVESRLFPVTDDPGKGSAARPICRIRSSGREAATRVAPLKSRLSVAESG